MITYINPDAIEDQSTDWSKLKNVPEFPLMVNVTYGELKALRDSAELTAGQQYRITDYVTTTSQENTTSAGYQFDIIVTADSENTLNEVARATQHDDDTYFADSDLNAWQLKYCLDNDTERFAWANDASGESKIGTIKPASGVNASGTYTYDTPISKVIYYGTTYNLEIGVKTMINSGPPVYVTKTNAYTLVVEEAGSGYIAAGSGISVYGIVSHVGKGVIYRMIDEWGNDCPYDFKNIMFYHDGLATNVYTFTWIDEDYDVMDTSIFGNNGTLTYYGEIYGVYGNVIKPYIATLYNENSGECLGIKQLLNNITFISDYECEGVGNNGFYGCYSNSFGNNCYSNSFGNECQSNSFGNYCYNNTFGNSCYNNTFGDECYRNSLRAAFQNNTFGKYCYINSFDGICYSNSFGNYFQNNTFDFACYRNSFGNGCYNNTFGMNCQYNSFGNNCIYNTFGGAAIGNSFGNYCIHNTLGSNCQYNSFGNSCQYNSFGNYCQYNSFRISAANTVTLLNYCLYNHFDDGCSYNIIWNSTQPTSSNKLQNIHVVRGLSGTTTSDYKFINITTKNAAYEIKVAKNSSGTIKIYCEAD